MIKLLNYKKNDRLIISYKDPLCYTETNLG